MKNERLNQKIKESHYTQEKLAAKVKVTGKTIYNAIQGTMPHENTRKAIAKALNCSVEDIFNVK